MDTPKHCAYNQTNECFLGLEVDAADFSEALLEDRLPALRPGSGAGLWMVPFRGIPENLVRIPLDLVYLDESCRVIAVVEAFPISHVSPSCRPANSVLALPALSIRASQTKPEDQLVLCPAKDMVHRLNQLASSAAQSALPEPEASKVPEEQPSVSPAESKDRVEPETVKKKKKSWLERFLSGEPKGPAESRRAPRKLAPGLYAYFWTGATPEPHPIRDVSLSGLYVVTEERWYPGTLIRLTLTRKERGLFGTENSISVQARAVRWGNDGVGLQFAAGEPQSPGHLPGGEGANRRQLDEFLRFLKGSE